MQNRIINVICSLLVVSFLIWNYSTPVYKKTPQRDLSIKTPIVSPVFNEKPILSLEILTEQIENQKVLTQQFLELEAWFNYLDLQIKEMQDLSEIKISNHNPELIEFLNKEQSLLFKKLPEPIYPPSPSKKIENLMKETSQSISSWWESLNQTLPEENLTLEEIESDEAIAAEFESTLSKPETKQILFNTLLILEKRKSLSTKTNLVKIIEETNSFQKITEIYLTNGFDLIILQVSEPLLDAPFMPSNKAMTFSLKLNNKPVLDFNAAWQPKTQTWHSFNINKFISGSWTNLMEEIIQPLPEPHSVQVCEKDCFF